MPIFEVKLTDGRKFEVKADHMPTEQEIYAALGEGPQDSGQGYVSSLVNAAGRGVARVAADVPGGIGYLVGSESLIQTGEDIEASINEALPVNPIYQDSFGVKAAGAVGQGASALVTGGVGGAVGRTLGAVRTGAEVASLGSAFLGGARSGGQEAEQYGIEGAAGYGRMLAGGAIELATERFLFGLGDETRAVRNLAGETIEGVPEEAFSLLGRQANDLLPSPFMRSMVAEGGEEFVSGISGNALTSALAPEGVQTPGMFEGALENFALGAIAGGVIGGIGELTSPAPAPLMQPVQAEIDGQRIVRGEDGTLYREVDPETNDGLPLQPLIPTEDPLLMEKAQQLFFEADQKETPGVDPTTFVPTPPVEAAPVEPEIEITPTGADSPALPTETTTTEDPRSLDAVETPVVEVAVEAPVEGVPVEEPVLEETEIVTEVAEPVPVPVPVPVPEAATEPPTVQAPAEQPSFLGISNAAVDEQRKRLGLPATFEPMRQTLGQWWEAGLKAIEANPTAGTELVDSTVADPKVLTPTQSAVLAHEHVTRSNAYENALVEYNSATPEAKPAAEQKVIESRVRLEKVLEAINLSGTPAGQALVARRMMLARDFSLARMDMERRAANKGTLSPEQVEQTVQMQDRIAKLEQQIAEYQTAQNDNAAQEYFKKLKAETRIRQQKAQKEGKSLTEILDDAAEAARKRIRSRKGNMNLNMNPLEFTDRVIIGASHIARGIRNFAEWSAKMVEEFGEAIRPYLPDIFTASQEMHNAEQAAFSAAEAREDTRPVMEQVAANAANNQALPDRLVYELIKDKARNGAQTLTDAVAQATADLRSVYPEITERQVRDQFSGYGRVKYPSKDDLNRRMRELRTMAQLTSAIEDVSKGIPAKKSGMQRDRASQQVRDMRKELNRLMQENGIQSRSAVDQLRSSLDGIKSRLRNEIEDLTKQIEKREKRKRKPSPEYDAETKALKDQRDTLKKTLDDLAPDPGPTPEQRIDQAVKALERDIEELERRIREKDFSSPEVEAPMTQHLQVLRDKRDALREQYTRLRDEALGEPQLTEEQLRDRALKRMDREIEKLERQLKTGDFSVPQAQKPQMTPELRAARHKLQALREQRDAIKSSKTPTSTQKQEAAEARLEESVDELNRRIDEADLDTPRGKEAAPDSARVRALKAERDSLRGILEAMRKEKREQARDPVAAQLKRDKASIRRRMEAVRKRIDTRDFSPPIRPTPVMDAEKSRMLNELEDLQQQWAKIVFEEGLANRSPMARLVDTAGQTLSTARAILTSADLSAVFRQGGFLVLGNPARGIKNFLPMLRAFRSKDAERDIRRAIEERPNFQLYKQAKLFLAGNASGTRMSQQEEAFMTRWLDKIPTWAGGGIFRGSQRAYTSFLDLVRADTFDAMLSSLQAGQTPTPAEARAVADFINIATGRGDLGKMTQAATVLNTVFFAPRLVASRFQILFGVPYFRADARTKRLVLREYAKFLTGAAIVYALGSLAMGDDDEPIETDPRSSDFGKIRFGNTRVDPMGGLIQATVLLSRLAMGEKKTTAGKIVPLRGDGVPYGGATSYSVMADFLRSKFSPTFGAIVNIIQGKNVVGEPTDVGQEALRMVIPMTFAEAAETMEEQGVPRGTALTMLSILGMGVQTYDPGKR